MATSLAQQLQALSAPQTSRLTKEHAISSLLFQPKEAAELERDDIYVIALNGLEELESLVPYLSKFRKTLFSEESKYLERSVQAKEVEKKLNKNISEFLRLLSPFFLLKPAHKTLEWLIRRFQIHLYNTDDLMKCALPYHESNVFARVVQILDFKLHSSKKWRWLASLQKNGIPLSKGVLFNYCSSNFGMLKIIFDVVEKTVKCVDILNESSLKTIISFYMSTIIGVLKQLKSISEEFLTYVAPFLLFGLKSTIKDLISASYLILVCINQEVNLEQAWIEPILETILQNFIEGMEREAVCSVAISIFKQEMSSISSRCCKLLLKKQLRLVIQELSAKTFLEPLCRILLMFVAKEALKGTSKHLKNAKWLLSIFKVNEKDMKYIISLTVDVLPELDDEDEHSVKEIIKDLLNALETKNSFVFDQCLGEILTDRSIAKQLFAILGRKRNIRENLSLSSNWISYLEHPSAAFRKSAVETIDSVDVDDKTLNDVLLTRLKDDDPNVVLSVLELSKFSKLSANFTRKALINLVCENYSKNEWCKVLKSSLTLLSASDFDKMDENLLSLLPLMFPISTRSLNMSKKIIFYGEFKSDLNVPIFWKLWKDVGKYVEEIEANGESFNQILNNFFLSVSSMNQEERDFLLLELLKKDRFAAAEEKFLSIVFPQLLAAIVTANNCSESSLKLVFQFFSPNNLTLSKYKIKDLELSTVLATKNYLDLYSLIKQQKKFAILFSSVYAINHIINKCDKTNGSAVFIFNEVLSWMSETNSKSFYFSNLILKCFIKKCVFDADQLATLLFSFIETNEDNYLAGVYCLTLIKELLSAHNYEQKTEMFLLNLLSFCNSKQECIRKACLDCLSAPLFTGRNKFGKFSQYLLSFRREIENDFNYLPTILGKYITQEGDDILVFFEKWLLDTNTSDFIRLGILNYLNGVSSSVILNGLLHIANKLLKDSSLSCYKYTLLKKILLQLNSPLIGKFDDFNLLKEVLSLALLHKTSQLEDLVSVQKIALNQIENIYGLLGKTEHKRSLIRLLLDVNSNSSPDVESLKISDTLTNLLTEGFEIAYHLESFLADGKSPLLREMTPGESESSPQLLLILESVEGKPNIKNNYLVISTLFKILKRNLDKINKNDYELELVVNCLHQACNHLKPECVKTDLSDFHIELLIKCLQRKSSPRIHSTILLILSLIAEMFPEFVLRNAVLVFALMTSGSFLHQDDSYSFGIVITTLEKVLPSIFKVILSVINSETKLKSISNWMKIFVGAVPDILDHRRHALLKTLLTSIEDSNKYLWLLLGQLLELYVVWESKGNFNRRGVEERKSVFSFAVDFCQHFAVADQMSAARYLLKELAKILKNFETEIEWLDLTSEKHKNHFCHTTLSFVSSIFSSDSFLNQLIEEPELNAVSFKKITKIVLRILNTVQKSNRKDSKNWIQLSSKCYQLLDKTMALIPLDLFIEIIDKLLESDDIRLQCKVVEIFTLKLQRNGKKLEFKYLANIFDRLLAIVKHHSFEDVDRLMLLQLALYSFKFFARYCASQDIEAFQKVASVTISALKKQTNQQVISSGLLCLAELCQVLRAHFIVNLSKLMPILMGYFEDDSKLIKNEPMLLSLVTLLSKIIECQESFLSPYLSTILSKIAFLCTVQLSDGKIHKAFSARLTSICRNLSRKVEPRVLLPAIKSCYETIIQDSPKYVATPMAILAESLRVVPDPVRIWQDYLSNFFFISLDYRSTHKEEGEEMISLIEQSLLGPVLVLVMKMSETTFRPFFLKFYDWATKDGASKERLFTFYKLTNSIADKLKNLFGLFAGHFLLNVVSLLETNNTSKDSVVPTFQEESMNDNLLRHIFDILLKCFTFDAHGFLTKERFFMLMPPLVDQLDNEMGDYDERNKYLIPCLAHLTQAVTTDVNLQPFIYNILTKSRSSSSEVRIAALETVRQVAKKMNEDFLSLLPETIPFLAELMEDDVVEDKCQMVIADLEEIVGEPLQKYFNG